MDILKRERQIKGGVAIITSTVQDKMTLRDLQQKKALIEREEGNIDRQILILHKRKADLAEDKAFIEECIRELNGGDDNGE